MHKYSRLIVLLVIWLISLDCPAYAESVPHLKIGVILPLTGVTADYGESVKNSIELARSDKPELFGSIEFVYEDASYDAKQAVTAFQKLATQDKVDLVYVWGIAFCKAVAPLAERAKIPLIAQCIDPAIARNRSYVVRFMNYTDQYLLATTQYLASQKRNRLAVVVTDNAYLEEMLEALKRTRQPNQEITELQRYQATEMDFRSTISRLRDGSYDAIGVFLSAGQIATFFRQLREQGISITSFGTNFFESLSEIEAAQTAMDGAIFANNEVALPFIERFRQKFGKVSQIGFGSLAYEFALTVGRITTNLPEDKLSGLQVLADLEKLPKQQGTAAGPYRFRNDSHVGRFFEFPIAIKQIKGNEFIVIDHFDNAS